MNMAITINSQAHLIIGLMLALNTKTDDSQDFLFTVFKTLYIFALTSLLKN